MIDPADLNMVLRLSGAERLRGARILMTGGTGFVGRWMRLARDVRALDRHEYEAGEWKKERWDYIIHLAIAPPEQVIECAERCHAQILFSSSGAVFDAQPGEYALGKIYAERELLISGLPVKIARMFTFCGGWMQNRYAVINMITDSLAGADLRVRSTKLSVTRSYLYAADMAIWLWRILLDGQPGAIYEVGSPEAVTMEQLARQVQKNFSPPPLMYHEPMMTFEPRPHYVPTQAEATMLELGVKVYTPFDEAIKKTVAWYRQEEQHNDRTQR